MRRHARRIKPASRPRAKRAAPPASARNDKRARRRADIAPAESCLIAALGGALGLGGAWLMTAGGSPAPALLPIFYIPVQNLALGASLILVLGLATGAIPAFQAMRLGVAEALRRQA